MATDKKITELPAATAPTGVELVEIVQGGVNKQTTTQDIANLGGGGGGSITSVNGDTGPAVTLDAIDIPNTPAGTIAATTVQAAINELDTEKQSAAQVQAIADAKVADAINNGTTTVAPSQNAVFDALALKQDIGGSKVLVIACSDEVTPITATTNKVKFRMPYAMTLTAVRASLSTTQTSGSIFTVDINETGTTILSTKLTIDNGETTSTTAATPPVISDSALADNAEISIDVDQIGDNTAKGLKVTLIGS